MMDYKTFKEFRKAYYKALNGRKTEMLRLRAEGLTLDEIGAKWNLTRQRVYQIIGDEQPAEIVNV